MLRLALFAVFTISIHAAEKGVSPETSVKWLTNGNARFNKSYVRKDGQSPADIARLSRGQRPHAVVLSCSDSRVPPEIVFDQKLGELFTVRTGGPSLDENAVKAIEYGVKQGARMILVMGHTSCGMLAEDKQDWTNTEGVARDLIRRSVLIGKKWESGELWIVPSLYDLESGKVAFRENLAHGSKRTPTAEK